MQKELIAGELVEVAKILVAIDAYVAKGDVPEAFKKQWKVKDKDGDGKTNEPKPDFLKEKEKGKKSSDADIAASLVDVAKMLVGEQA